MYWLGRFSLVGSIIFIGYVIFDAIKLLYSKLILYKVCDYNYTSTTYIGLKHHIHGFGFFIYQVK